MHNQDGSSLVILFFFFTGRSPSVLWKDIPLCSAVKTSITIVILDATIQLHQDLSVHCITLWSALGSLVIISVISLRYLLCMAPMHLGTYFTKYSSTFMFCLLLYLDCFVRVAPSLIWFLLRTLSLLVPGESRNSGASRTAPPSPGRQLVSNAPALNVLLLLASALVSTCEGPGVFS